MENAISVIQFNDALVKTGPLYKSAQPLKMSIFVPADKISTFYISDNTIHLQLGQRIVEAPYSGSNSTFLDQISSGTWKPKKFNYIEYWVNIDRVSCITGGTSEPRFYQQPGITSVDDIPADLHAFLASSLCKWDGPYHNLHSEGYVYINLGEIDAIIHRDDYIQLFPRGAYREPVVVQDKNGNIASNLKADSTWIPIDNEMHVNANCAAYLAFGSGVTTESRHNIPGLHLGSNSILSIPSSHNGQNLNDIFAQAASMWTVIEFSEETSGVRINPARIELMAIEDNFEPGGFVLMSEGRYHWHGPLTEPLKNLKNRFVTVATIGKD